MRTSRISQETTRIFNALSPNTRRTRTTRSAASGIATFALGYDGSIEVKDEQHNNDLASTPSEIEDIEDVARSPVPSKKRKYGTDSPTTTVATTLTAVEYKSKRTTPRKKHFKHENSDPDTEDEQEATESSPQGRTKAKPKIPARRITLTNGSVQVQPPSNWAEIYDIIKQMRERNPTAPVDTMGCEDLFWPTAPPKQKRYHTLTALMLSSQTKDTVTAAAMHRLHTELVPQPQAAPKSPADSKLQPQSSSLLTVDNILACDPVHLDQLIGKVGFHNNKTKFIKAAAIILRDEYAGDIPNTIEGLVRLPGVGPKMAYLCMSAAWGIDEGIGVDVHVHRITNLWGWHKTKSPEETRAWLESWLPRDKWHHINKMLVGLGQTVCLPVGRRCGECDLAGTGLCKAEIRGWKATERRVKKEKVEVGKEDEGKKVSVRIEEVKQGDVDIKEELIGE